VWNLSPLQADAGYAGCWSRAALYELADDATISLVWQFEVVEVTCHTCHMIIV
jgi:hypothetical protein